MRRTSFFFLLVASVFLHIQGKTTEHAVSNQYSTFDDSIPAEDKSYFKEQRTDTSPSNIQPEHRNRVCHVTKRTGLERRHPTCSVERDSNCYNKETRHHTRADASRREMIRHEFTERRVPRNTRTGVDRTRTQRLHEHRRICSDSQRQNEDKQLRTSEGNRRVRGNKESERRRYLHEDSISMETHRRQRSISGQRMPTERDSDIRDRRILNERRIRRESNERRNKRNVERQNKKDFSEDRNDESSERRMSRIFSETRYSRDVRHVSERRNLRGVNERRNTRVLSERRNLRGVNERRNTRVLSERRNSRDVSEGRNNRDLLERQNRRDLDERSYFYNGIERRNTRNLSQRQNLRDLSDRRNRRNLSERKISRDILETRTTRALRPQHNRRDLSERRNSNDLSERRNSNDLSERRTTRDSSEMQISRNVNERWSQREFREQRGRRVDVREIKTVTRVEGERYIDVEKTPLEKQQRIVSTQIRHDNIRKGRTHNNYGSRRRTSVGIVMKTERNIVDIYTDLYHSNEKRRSLYDLAREFEVRVLNYDKLISDRSKFSDAVWPLRITTGKNFF